MEWDGVGWEKQVESFSLTHWSWLVWSVLVQYSGECIKSSGVEWCNPLVLYV